MEDKLPNDRLEEFLRKSLEGHIETPPADLWSRIEGDLEPPGSVVQPKLLAMKAWRAVAAAAAVVVLLLVGQHLYFRGKINKMSQELERNCKQLQQMEEQKLTEQPGETKQEFQRVDEEIAKQNGSKNNTVESVPATENNGINAQIPTKKQDLGKPDANFAEQKKQPKIAVKKQPSQQLKNGLENEKTNADGVANEQKNNTTIPQQPIDNQSIGKEAELVKTADMPKVWPKQIKPLELPSTNLMLPNSAILVAPKLSKTPTSIGVHAMPMASEWSIHEIKDDDGPGHHPGGPGHEAPREFDTEHDIVGKSLSLGLNFEKQVLPRLSLGTGLDYRKLTYKSTHEFELPFKDRDGHNGPHMPGHGDNDHEFEYNLNTAVGTVTMDLRAVSTDTTIAIPDDEEVAAKIHSTQQLSYANLPLYAQYSVGNGRLRVLAKAGFVFNFMLNNQFNVDSVESLNPRFEFRRGDNQSGDAANLQSVTLDYTAGLGLEYQLSKSLSLRLEPSIVGSLTSRHNNPLIQSSEFSAGLDMGVRYNF